MARRARVAGDYGNGHEDRDPRGHAWTAACDGEQVGRLGPCGGVRRALGSSDLGPLGLGPLDLRYSDRGANPAAQQVGDGARRMDGDPCASRDRSLLRRELK